MKTVFLKVLSLTLVLVTLLACMLTGCDPVQKPDDGKDKGDENDDSSKDDQNETYEKTFGDLSLVEYDPLDYIKVPNFKDITLNKSIIEGLMNYELARIAMNGAEKETFSEKDSTQVKLYDTANITFTGESADENVVLSEETIAAMSNASSEKGSDLAIGSNTFIGEYFSQDESKRNKGFEEQLIGASVGETRVITVTFPDNYGTKELCGVVVNFTVTINSITRSKVESFIPSDDKCKVMTGYETLAELTEYLEEYYTQEYAYSLVYGSIEITGQCDEIFNIYFDQCAHSLITQSYGEKLSKEDYEKAYADVVKASEASLKAQATSMSNEYIVMNYLFDLCSVTLSEEEFTAEVNAEWEKNKEYYMYYGMNSVEEFIETVGRVALEETFKINKLVKELPGLITIVDNRD